VDELRAARSQEPLYRRSLPSEEILRAIACSIAQRRNHYAQVRTLEHRWIVHFPSGRNDIHTETPVNQGAREIGGRHTTISRRLRGNGGVCSRKKIG
jgi:hypothetical protein